MGLLDDIKKEKEALKEKEMAMQHPVEDIMINQVLALLEKRICNEQYNRDASYDLDEYYIKAFLAKVTYKNGYSGYELLDEQWGWEEGEYRPINRPNILYVDTHPFDKFDYEYITEILPIKVREKIGAGCSVRCTELFNVRKRLFKKFNDVIHLDKHTITVEMRWRF